MLYFIPAWYQKNAWSENEQNWYEKRMHTEFDDTVKQVQLFHRNGAYQYRIMLLGHAPNFRHFLHRQSVYHAPYWSCFDAIQEVRRKKMMVLSFHSIDWPKDIEFIYTQFAVLALLHQKKYAKIDFGEDGNPIRIQMYEDGKIIRKNIYDDRGFVSSTILYDEEEEPLYQDYLMENGIWKIRHYFADDHVEVNPKNPEYLLRYEDREIHSAFRQLRYGNLSEVIREVTIAYIRFTSADDIFCVAMHQQHTQLLHEILRDRKMILSFFEERFSWEEEKNIRSMMLEADHIVADSYDNSEKIRTFMGDESVPITEITPFDTRVDFGISQQLSVQKILVPVDGLQDHVFESLVRQLGNYMLCNKNAQIHLFTRCADLGIADHLLAEVRMLMGEENLPIEWAVPEGERKVCENDLDDYEEPVPARFFVEECVDELSVSKCMREQRIMVDMRETPELYMQIMAISVGIPQIIQTPTQYLQDSANGIVLQELDRLKESLDFYLDGLAHWNEAMISCYEIGKKYTTKVLLQKWKEVIESIG